MNELNWLLLMMVNFVLIIVVYRLFSVSGLYVWIAISVIVANIQVLKTVELFGFTATLGNIAYATSFLATDILAENHGPRVARRGVILGLIAMVSMTLLMSIALLFEPAPDDFADGPLREIFSIVPRITGASLVAYLVSQWHDIWAFERWKRFLPARKFLWIRNNASTVVSQLIDSTIFTIFAFAGIFSTKLLIEIAVTTYLFKIIVAFIDTPFIYLASRKRS